jgi:hypothetical protein
VSDPVLDALAGLLDGPAWLVGGAVRDRLLERATDDYDVVVLGDARSVAQALARSLRAHPFALSDAFGVWRVVAHDHSWQVDVLPVVDSPRGVPRAGSPESARYRRLALEATPALAEPR